MERYQRQIQLEDIGLEGQQALANAKVLVVGAGGLGSPVLQYLAASGVGFLGVADMDTVALSNLHRQLLYTTADVGKPKVQAAQERLESLNPDVEINVYPEGVHTANIMEMIAPYDLIIDGTDNFSARYLINDACVKSDKAWIYGALFKHQGQFALFNHRGGPCYRCLYPKPPAAGEVAGCNVLGVLGTVAGIIGLQMAHLALQTIIWPEEVPNQSVFYVNQQNFSVQHLKMDKNQSLCDNVQSDSWELPQNNAITNCETPPNTVSLKEALLLDQALFLDVRDTEEQPKIAAVDLQIPVKELEQRLKELDKEKTYIAFCKSGQRAKAAATLLKAHDFEAVYALSASAQHLKNAIENENSTTNEVY
ncbi:HesA/MoeB/ThiF family protein [Gilvibacter sp.]|uniref:HesA/MoeB/ThiF family protein n=1 Tax=Gilvibacter sp. TaxID=2729997 RepID=UPI0025C47D53|nr:HesA/MoeB/ThiF family protein [Gilvibacter sp.]NQX77982.1 ThiF family adenylyltransferase [Gilvibacter sp.]